MRAVLILLYLVAIAAANLITTAYGPEASVYTALGLVAFDLVARDVLHDRTSGRRRWALMALLVVAGGIVAYAINAEAQRVAIASAAALTSAFVLDTIVYHRLRHRPWFERVNLSNVPAAIVDSLVFVAVAFPGPVLWGIVATQAGMKVAGGVVFAALLERVVRVGVYAPAR